MYEGELFDSLKSVDPKYWSIHNGDVEVLKVLIEKILSDEEIVSDIVNDAKEMLSVITPENKR